MLKGSLFVPVCLTLMVVLLAPSICGHMLVLQPNVENCFFEVLAVGDKMGITFEVGEGGRLDIDFRVSSPSGRVIHEGQREKANTYSFIAEEQGAYTYCFSNLMSVRATKFITFSVTAQHQNAPKQQQDAPEASTDATDLEKEVNELLASLKAVKDSQQYLRVRERAHRDTSESTNSRIQWWSIFQVVILIGLCIFQIFYLRNFFEIKQTV